MNVNRGSQWPGIAWLLKGARGPRKHTWRALAVLGLLMFVEALPSYAARPSATRAEIVNTGSTNRAGYLITVWRSGHASYKIIARSPGPQMAGSKSGTVSATIPRQLASRFFNDLKAAMPISSMPRENCAKSVSFGSSTYIKFARQTSPDISCPGHPDRQALFDDARQIAGLFSSTETPAGAPDSAGPAASHQVTLEDDNKVVAIKVGDTVVLHLGTGMDWRITRLDQSILRRKIGVMPVRGSQGIFEAIKAGETELDATGDPPCRKTTPPCAAPSRLFRVTFVVK